VGDVRAVPREQKWKLTDPGKGFLRIFFRAPILFFRLGLGPLLKNRYFLLTHRGRRSGRVYKTVLDVYGRGPDGELYVSSGWGSGSDWYRNITSGGALKVRVGREVFTPSVRVLDGEETIERHRLFRENHLQRARFSDLVTGFKPSGSEPVELELARHRPILELSPHP
jgi:deazaflavin-dependent oxidoreductase (nitroreductase family)